MARTQRASSLAQEALTAHRNLQTAWDPGSCGGDRQAAGSEVYAWCVGHAGHASRESAGRLGRPWLGELQQGWGAFARWNQLRDRRVGEADCSRKTRVSAALRTACSTLPRPTFTLTTRLTFQSGCPSKVWDIEALSSIHGKPGTCFGLQSSKSAERPSEQRRAFSTNP